MNAIIGFSRLVMHRSRDVLPARQLANLGRIQSSADHLLSLINDILDLSKIEARRMDVQPVAFAVAPLIGECLRTVESMIRSDQVRLVEDIQPDLPTLIQDQDKVRQILINLLSNAVKFTEAGAITIRASACGATVAVAVADTGIGIPDDAQARVFEEFGQVGGSNTRQRGTGLGLAISRRLASLLGGDLSLRSTLGQGSTFTLTLPVRYATAPALAPPDRQGVRSVSASLW
jgi:signal transduction histidine kinase